MAKIFISYRRSDAEFVVTQICEFLVKYFGPDSVFRDVDNIPLASDFEAVLNKHLDQADVVIAVITKDWLAENPETGNRRICEPRDFIRYEIKHALQRGIPILPFVLSPARMPQEHELPEDIREFHKRQALTAYPGSGFGVSLLQLVEALFVLMPQADRRKSRKILLEDTQAVIGKGHQQTGRKSRHSPGSSAKLIWTSSIFGLLAIVFAIVFIGWIWNNGARTSTADVSKDANAEEAKDRIVTTWTKADQLRLEKEISSMRARAPEPRKTRLENSREEISLGAPDYSNFEILGDDRYWDLRGWKDLTDSENQECFIILTRRVRLLKVAPAKEIRFEAKTDGRDVFVESISHPAGAYELVASDAAFVGERKTKLRQLAIDVTSVPVGEEITIAYRATYWNSLQNPDDRWLGAIGYPRADRLRMYILMPDGLPYKSFKLREAPSFRDDSRDYDGPRRILETEDHLSLLWEVPTPNGNWVYTVILDW